MRAWLTEQFGPDEDLFAELYAQYATDMKERCTHLPELLAAQNAKSIGDEGHAMKGMALQMGDSGVADLCLNLQNEGRSGNLSACVGLIEKISAAVAAL